MDMSVDKVITAVNCLDLKTLPLESVEILQRMCPTEQEVSLHSSYYEGCFTAIHFYIFLKFVFFCVCVCLCRQKLIVIM